MFMLLQVLLEYGCKFFFCKYFKESCNYEMAIEIAWNWDCCYMCNKFKPVRSHISKIVSLNVQKREYSLAL